MAACGCFAALRRGTGDGAVPAPVGAVISRVGAGADDVALGGERRGLISDENLAAERVAAADGREDSLAIGRDSEQLPETGCEVCDRMLAGDEDSGG